MNLHECANRVQQEFGSVLPDPILSFEDCRREFVSVMMLKLQEIGISDTDRTTAYVAWTESARQGIVPTSFGPLSPAFVEFHPTGSEANWRDKVEIVPVEDIPSYEGSRAIAFHDLPLRYRAAWDYWNSGTMYLWFDPLPNLETITAEKNVLFPVAFMTYLIKCTALNLVEVVTLKLAWLAPEEQRELIPIIAPSLTRLAARLESECEAWKKEFRKYINLDSNQSPRLRRTWDELKARGYNNVTGNNPMDFIG